MDPNSRSHLFNYLGLNTNSTSSSCGTGATNTTTSTISGIMSNSQQQQQHQASLDCQALKQMLDTQSLVDCTLACDGGKISAHKVVLSACSTYLAKILLDHPVEHPIIILPELSIEDVRTLIHYMYTGELLKPSQNNNAGSNTTITGSTGGNCSNSISLLRTAAILSINSLIDLVAANSNNNNNSNSLLTHHLQPFQSAPINLMQVSASLQQRRPTQVSSIVDELSPLLTSISQQQQQQQQQKMFQFQANCFQTNENPLMTDYKQANNSLAPTATATAALVARGNTKPNVADFGHNAFALNPSNFGLNYNYTATSLNSSLTSSSASFGALSSPSSSLLSSAASSPSSSSSSSSSSSCSPLSLSSSPQQQQQQQQQQQNSNGATPSLTNSTNTSTIVDQLAEGVKLSAKKAAAAAGASVTTTPLDCSSSQLLSGTGSVSPAPAMPLSALSLTFSANINQSMPVGAASTVDVAAAASASLNEFQFKCPVCQNNFQTICSFEYHMQRVHNVTSFGCELCQKQFASLCYVLNDHMRRCHGWKGRESGGGGGGGGGRGGGGETAGDNGSITGHK